MFWLTVASDFQKRTESLEKSCSKRKSCCLGLRVRKDVSKSQALLKCRWRRTTWEKSNRIFPSFQWKSMPGWRTLSFSGSSAHLWTSKLPTWVRLKKKKKLKELPWWLSGFDPWSEETPQAVEQLSPCTTTTEPVLCSLGATTPEALTSEDPRSTGESLQREACASPQRAAPARCNSRKARAATKTQHSQKQTNF